MWKLGIFGIIALFAIGSLAFEGFEERILGATEGEYQEQTYQIQLTRFIEDRQIDIVLAR